MVEEKCPNCGANSFRVVGKYKICNFCDSKFLVESKQKTTIDLNDDVSRLLKKCKDEPWNAKRYANLILDIDPTNEEAKKYL